MIGYLITIATDGSIAKEPLSRPPTLDRLREIVGGYIEVVPFFNTLDGAPCVAFCNEHGKLDQLPVNLMAQALWLAAKNNRDPGDYLVGDIAIVIGDAELMSSL